MEDKKKYHKQTVDVGNFIKLKKTSIYYDNVSPDKHNPINKIGVVIEIGNPTSDMKRTNDLPILVNWGNFTNTYKYVDLEAIHL